MDEVFSQAQLKRLGVNNIPGIEEAKDALGSSLGGPKAARGCPRGGGTKQDLVLGCPKSERGGNVHGLLVKRPSKTLQITLSRFGGDGRASSFQVTLSIKISNLHDRQ